MCCSVKIMMKLISHNKSLLPVSEIERNPEQISHTGENSVTAVSVSVPIAVVMLILAVSVLLILIRRQRRTNTVSSQYNVSMFFLLLNDTKHSKKKGPQTIQISKIHESKGLFTNQIFYANMNRLFSISRYKHHIFEMSC